LPYRRQGLPCRGLVDRQGDLFMHSGDLEQTAWIAQALSIRSSVVEVLGLPWEARGGTNTVVPARKRRADPNTCHDLTKPMP
jgi:hypothetical protein